MLAIATYGEVAALLFYTPTQYGSDRFRQIFIDHWERWWDFRREEIPADQRAYVQKMVEKMMGHPPLAMSHLTHYQGKQVRFWYKETATGLRRDVSLSALDFISLIVKHIPPKGMQLMRHAGLYARNTKAKWAQKVKAALEAIRCQLPLFDLNLFAKSFDPLT
jgi:hypothetical protein